MADENILRHSVTLLDHADVKKNGTASAGFLLQIMVPTVGSSSTDLPAFWSKDRDYYLRASLTREDMWGAAVGKAISEYAARGFTIEDTEDSKLRPKRAQGFLLHADNGQGWVPFITKVLRDFLTTDNGAFIEVVRATGAPGARILGLMHLDSLRVTRTADDDYPVLYRDRQGREHILRDYQVLTFADMVDPGETYNGVGNCAAARVYRTIYKLAAMERYAYEKLTGSGATGIVFISGITANSMEAAIESADAQQVAKGRYYYKGKIMIPVASDAAVNLSEIALKDLPDGFDIKQERDNAYTIYANAIGIPVQDIQPLSGQGLGTGTQTVILDKAAEGQGLAAFSQDFTHKLNEHVLPETTTFQFSVNDIRDKKSQADVSSVRAATRKQQLDTGEIDADQARQMAADAGDIPKEFLDKDLTPSGTLEDDEKPVGDEQPDVAGEPDEPLVPAERVEPVVPPQRPPQRPSTKAWDYADVRELLDDAEEEAAALVDEVSE